jgi:hypothetical protein
MERRTLPPDRRVILASLRDYIEQVREEGLEGLPAGVESGDASTPAVARPARIETQAARSAAESRSPLPVELFSVYPGLEKTADLRELR